MPLIPVPTNVEPELTYEQELSQNERVRILAYLDCPSWKCKACKAVIFGRINYCVYCKNRLGVDTPRS